MRLAATVMLLRPAAGGFEVFMLRRSASSAFAPDVYVFPGGTLEAQDSSDDALERTYGLDSSRIAKEFRARERPELPTFVAASSKREGVALFIAALRELYEEAGVLLACDRDGSAVSSAALRAHRVRLHEARALVQSGELPFAELLRELDLFADARPLALFSQWITPPSESRRYNAHFFVARVEAGQTAAADAYETHDGIWIAPQAALKRLRDGTFAMVYPTVKHVERLARFDDADALLAFAREKTIVRIMPDTTAESGFAMPEELEHAW